jgi:hypothetical protein
MTDFNLFLERLRTKYNVASSEVGLKAIMNKHPEIDPNNSEDAENRSLLAILIEDESNLDLVDYLLNIAPIRADPNKID